MREQSRERACTRCSLSSHFQGARPLYDVRQTYVPLCDVRNMLIRDHFDCALRCMYKKCNFKLRDVTADWTEWSAQGKESVLAQQAISENS